MANPFLATLDKVGLVDGLLEPSELDRRCLPRDNHGQVKEKSSLLAVVNGAGQGDQTVARPGLDRGDRTRGLFRGLTSHKKRPRGKRVHSAAGSGAGKAESGIPSTVRNGKGRTGKAPFTVGQGHDSVIPVGGVRKIGGRDELLRESSLKVVRARVFASEELVVVECLGKGGTYLLVVTLASWVCTGSFQALAILQEAIKNLEFRQFYQNPPKDMWERLTEGR